MPALQMKAKPNVGCLREGSNLHTGHHSTKISKRSGFQVKISKQAAMLDTSAQSHEDGEQLFYSSHVKNFSPANSILWSGIYNSLFICLCQIPAVCCQSYNIFPPFSWGTYKNLDWMSAKFGLVVCFCVCGWMVVVVFFLLVVENGSYIV